MTQRLLNHMKLQASLSSRPEGVKIGIVSSYNPNNYTCKVMIQPDNIETGWLPVTSMAVGNQWGVFCPPSVGDMVEVKYLVEGGYDSGYVTLRFFNDEDRPVLAKTGVIYIIHKSGSFIKFENDGTIHLTANTSIESTAPIWNHTGDIVVMGNITATQVYDADGDKSMLGMRTVYNAHVQSVTNNVAQPPGVGM